MAGIKILPEGQYLLAASRKEGPEGMPAKLRAVG
jgi:hypothetical protein